MFGVWLDTACMEGSEGLFIPKPGRNSYELVKSFRPMGLTSFFLKTMERLVDSYMRAGSLKSFPFIESHMHSER
jgi:hypothetical protein